jgi:uncharacterized membrane protein
MMTRRARRSMQAHAAGGIMPVLTADTFERPANMSNDGDPAVLYVRSYLLIRKVVGIIGILLPIILIIGEASFLKGSVQVRGSLSAYYHTSMQDIFVGSLCITGLLLITYMAGMPATLDFWFSLIAGVAVLVVAFFPTWRPGIPHGAPLCGSNPSPPGCSPIEQALGEGLTAQFHAVAAAVFILSLAVISFLFAHREKKYNNSETWKWFHIFCGVAILAAVAWVGIGGALKIHIWELTPLYLGEIISVWAFGASWLLKSTDLGRTLHPGSSR